MANAPTSIREQMEQERAARAAWVAANAKKPAAQARAATEGLGAAG